MENMNKLFIYAFALVVSMVSISCDSNESEEVEQVFSFSEIKELDLSLLDNGEDAVGYFTLEASGKCIVSSDRMWVTFSKTPDNGFSYDVLCDGNTAAVYVKVSNDARDFVESTAAVTLFAGSKEYLVGTIVRPANSYEFAVRGEDDIMVETIRINDKATAWFAFDANFECGIMDYPEWLMEPVWENGGYRFNVVEEFVPMEQSGVMVVGNTSLTERYELSVNYDGMNPETMTIEGDDRWGWIVSLDGKEFKKDASSLSEGAENTVIEDCLRQNVICRDYAYKTFFMESVAGTLLYKEDDEAWIKVQRNENDPKTVTVTVDEYGMNSSRSGYLFAVPEALSEVFMEKFSSNNSEETFVDEFEKYVMVQIVQKDSGFKVALVQGDEMTDIQCESDVNADYYIKLNGEYTITDIMACDVELGKSYVINTKLTAEDWAENYALHDINGVEIREKLWKLKVKEGDDGYFVINVTVPEEWDEELDKSVVLRLYTPDVVNIKALVLRVQE